MKNKFANFENMKLYIFYYYNNLFDIVFLFYIKPKIIYNIDIFKLDVCYL